MKKIRAVIESKEGSLVFLKSNGFKFSVPTEFIRGKVGEAINITFLNDEEDQKSSKEVAKELLKIAFRGE